ncbi:sugar phosphate isomerase/epimerase [Paenibacillus sp. CC-CFT747]|nr:sugar phosphate isomerase/epimerase [Paenibacillus sp. CC-CFT747]
MGFGTLAHTAGNLPLKELTAKLQNRGIDFVQLALTKAIGDIDTGTGKLSPGLASYIAEQFDRCGLRIGVLGCYINPVHPDPDIRRQEIARFKEHLRYARDFGTSIVATETGSLETYRQHDPERYVEIGWNVLRQTVEELAEEAERWGVTIGLEPVSSHTLSSARNMVRIMEEVPSSTLGVVFDPCNLLTPRQYEDQETFLEEAFRLFGPRIVLSHLKDVTLNEGKLREVRSGQGGFRTASFLEKLQQVKPFVDVSLEAVSNDTLDETVRYIRELAGQPVR